MLLDTSKGGWTILHSDCDVKRLDAKRTEGQHLWDVFAVPDVVGAMLASGQCYCACACVSATEDEKCTGARLTLGTVENPPVAGCAGCATTNHLIERG